MARRHAWAATALLAVGSVASAAAPATDCGTGAYRFEDGGSIDVAATSKGLRWRLPDGRTGVLGADGASTLGSTGRPDGHRLDLDGCPASSLRFDGRTAQRIGFVVRETRFHAGDVELAGRLVLPQGDGPVPVVVLVHGSEQRSALDHDAWQRQLPAAGVGAFVYDKRGTGRSTGRYTQRFDVLAADAAAAAVEARRLAGARLGALAYAGASQGGWVVPLAHARHRADRLIVSYGLTVSPAEENRSEVRQQLAERGFDADALAQADAVVAATEELMASGFRRGFDRYADARRRYRGAPWYAHVDGEFSGAILRYPPWLLRLAAPVARRRDTGTPWRHDPLPALRAADVPMLWILAGDDREAPPAQTRIDLERLQAEGEPIDLLEFPATDHGIVEFETAPDGRRTTTRVAAGYLDAVVDFAMDGDLDASTYGRAALRRARMGEAGAP